MFQFQYGSIKRVKPLTFHQRVRLFQFQYGSIKSNNFFFSMSPTLLFQFQYGSIKSPKGGAFGELVQCFNSNMVRLKEIVI